MSFQGFICEITTGPITAQECLACARSGSLTGCPMTAPVVTGILSSLHPDGFGLSVTTLLGCARKQRLQQEWDYWLRPSHLWWSYRGQLMHSIAAQYAQSDPNAIAELRFSMLLEAAISFIVLEVHTFWSGIASSGSITSSRKRTIFRTLNKEFKIKFL